MPQPTIDPETFIARWNGTERAERANYIPFLNDLCDLIGVPRPNPATGSLGDYRYERGVSRPEPDGRTSNRRIDLYKRGCFILEAKQAAEHGTQQKTLFPMPGQKEQDRRAMIRGSRDWAQKMLLAKG